ncbi:hypothetical protein GFS60_03465 [Rhodococcus sp. WAY2]|nr:hypothetical protein GFS60_03465 [Rhodococcus sp. WAY2]
MRPHPHRTPPTITAVEPKKAHGRGAPRDPERYIRTHVRALRRVRRDFDVHGHSDL